MSVHIISNNQGVAGDDDSLFILTGSSPGLELSNNDNSFLFLTSSPSFVSLTTSDTNENIFDLTGGHAGSNGTSAEVLVGGGVSGLSYIFGFGQDPNAEVFFVSGAQGGTPVVGNLTVAPDGFGGTLLSTSWVVSDTHATGHGAIDVIGDSRLAIASGSNAQVTILRNT
jgi:hypothetical protein